MASSKNKKCPRLCADCIIMLAHGKVTSVYNEGIEDVCIQGLKHPHRITFF